MSLADICICGPTRMIRGCPRHSPGDVSPEAIYAMFSLILENQENTMSALTDLQAADAALQSEVATFLADIVTALQNASSANDPAIEQVVSDINTEIAALQQGDPVNQTPAPAPAPTPEPQAGN